MSKMYKKNPFKSEKQLVNFCEDHQIGYFGVFGSYARGEDGPESDIDVLYELVDGGKDKTLFDIGRIQFELETLFQKKVDFVDRNFIKQALKPYIYEDLVTLYEGR